MTYKEKLEQELKAQIVMPIQRIAEALEKIAEGDHELQEAILKEEKNLKGCYEYIMKQARANSTGGSACFDDETVFNWAAEYFKAEEQEKKTEEVKEETKEKKKGAEKKKRTSKKKAEKEKQEEKQENSQTQLEFGIEGDDDDDIDLG